MNRLPVPIITTFAFLALFSFASSYVLAQETVKTPDSTSQAQKPVEMKLSTEELKAFTDLLKERELIETKIQLLQTQSQNVAMQQQLLQPELEKQRKSTVERWSELCKARKLDPAKWTLNPSTGEIVAAPTQK